MALIDREAVRWVAGLVGGAARQIAVAVLRHVADALRDEEEILSGTASADAVEPGPVSSGGASALEPSPIVEPAAPEPSPIVEPAAPEAPSPAPAAPAAVEVGELHDRILDALHTIYDPEIPVDIYELGLIYGVEIQEDASVQILMTLTSPNCPAAQSLPVEVEEKVAELDGVDGVEVEITFDPPWTPDLMSEEAKLELNLI